VSAPRPITPRLLAVGSALVVAGLAMWALYVKQSRSESHAYSHDGTPPNYVRLVAGDTYSIAIHGGVAREAELGLDPAVLQCTAARSGEAPGSLQLDAHDANTKATDEIASFVSEVSGEVHIECAQVGAVYVDDAADAPFDWSGVWLVFASLALVIGLPLTVSALRGTTVSAGSGAEYYEVE
jgi:hypothetical protein